MEAGTFTRGWYNSADISSGKLSGGSYRPEINFPRRHFMNQNYPSMRKISHPNSGYYSKPPLRRR